MKRLLILSILALALVSSVGCSKTAEETFEQKPAQDKTSQEKAVQEQTVEKEESKDPYEAAMVQVKMIDDQLNTYDKKEVKLPPVKEGWEEQTLCLWSDKGTPMKLTATEADDIGKMDGLSSCYFKNGKIVFYQAPFSNHVFENEKMILWLDENMNALDIPKEDIENAEKGILETVKDRLDSFN